ncbi:MAG: hypothetical protein ACTSVI_13735 [Promethearchaeota archaeon]
MNRQDLKNKNTHVATLLEKIEMKKQSFPGLPRVKGTKNIPVKRSFGNEITCITREHHVMK